VGRLKCALRWGRGRDPLNNIVLHTSSRTRVEANFFMGNHPYNSNLRHTFIFDDLNH